MRFTRVAIVVLCPVILLSFIQQQVHADKARVQALAKVAAGEDPDERARAIEELCAINSAEAAAVVLTTLEKEKDGPAGFRMADAVVKLTDADALKLIDKTIDKWNRPESLMGAYWLLSGLARQRVQAADDLLTELSEDINDRKVYIGAAYLEALATAGRTDFGHLLPGILKDYSDKWDAERWLFAATVLSSCARLTSEKDNDTRLKVVTALADVLEKTRDDRVRWFTCKALADTTGKPPYVQVEYWRWWVKVGGKTAEAGPEHEGRTSAGRRPPAFFDAESVGKRVVFVIDVSGSMSAPVNMGQQPATPEPEKKKGPVSGRGKDKKEDGNEEAEPEKPDYSKVVTKLDLAKVELIFTLRNLPDDYWFNIVTYGSTHSMIDQNKAELVQATARNKELFIKKVEELAVTGATNIHGALNRAFCVNDKKSLKPENMVEGKDDPASDLNCLLGGATTIFFLTDGAPNVSDEKNQPDRTVDPYAMPRFTRTENIIAEVRRLNLFRRAVIHTVGIGPHPKPLLEGLAKATGGSYIDRTGEPVKQDG